MKALFLVLYVGMAVGHFAFIYSVVLTSQDPKPRRNKITVAAKNERRRIDL